MEHKPCKLWLENLLFYTVVFWLSDLSKNDISVCLWQDVIKGYMRTQGVQILPEPEVPTSEERDASDQASDLEKSIPLTAASDDVKLDV